MKNNKGYLLAVVVLLILNGFLLFLLGQESPQHRSPRSHQNGLMKRISNTLALTVEQEQRYAHMARHHHQRMMEIDKEQKALITSYFQLLHAFSTDSTAIVTLLEKIKTKEGEKVQFTYRHFEELKALCNKEQQAHFEEITNEIVAVLLGSKKKRPLPPRDF
jgi:protein CpxP